MDFIPYGRQSIIQQDIDAVVDCLKSEYLTQGPAVPKFEGLLSDYCGSEYAIAVNSATSALHVACLALGVSAGDMVWTSPITFVATSNAALYCGASVDFVDIDTRTFNMCMTALAEKLAHAENTGTLPKVIIPVHMCGQSCDMQRLAELADKYKFSVIEDASHSVGASYAGCKVGCCKYSDITVFSFHPVKIVTTGEGGAALTNDPNLAHSMRLLRSHGVTKAPEHMQCQAPAAWSYEQHKLGFNYRMTDIAAALGCSQLDRLDAFVDARRDLVANYSTLLKDLPITLPQEDPEARSSFHLYVVTLHQEQISKRKRCFDSLRAAGIGVNVHYIPVYHQPYYQNLGFTKGYCNNAEDYYSRCLSLPLFPDLKYSEQQYVAASLQAALQL